MINEAIANLELTFTGGGAVFVSLCVLGCLADTLVWIFKPRKRNRKILRKAYRFAKRKHKGQKDDEGESYFKAHICQVVNILHLLTENTNTLIAGYLHDTLEDTDTSYGELCMEFNDEVADLVVELTHEGSKDNKGYFFPRLKSKKAILVKFADRSSNLSRMRAWTPDRQDQYIRKSKFWKSEV